ncbi:PHP domain-containing protein [Actinomycetospora sp. OC33-EN08]|uniref:PHP domain-containing protein n=1 Tax=Actinomycetospora aurantiaca TaxID=3129233 RepID=A0ABU8MRB0_9PSEU
MTRVPVDGDPIAALRAIAFYYERERADTYRVKAYRTAADRLAELDRDEVEQRARAGTLTDLKGVGKKTAGVVAEVVSTGTAASLEELAAAHEAPVAGGVELRAVLRGDSHTHSTWSDGGSDILEMARMARDLGHEWMVLTDHSQNLTVANGLSPERRRRQFDVITEVNEELAPFRLLRGIEVDILEDGSIDAPDDLLEELDLVVASVHSKLRTPSEEMTARMVCGVSHPLVDVLGHCTGRLVTGGRGTRPPSTFDAEAVFEACLENGVAVEINSRPERLDPPRTLLRQAVEAGCEFMIDTDAHAPGQLDWQPFGCERAVECEVPVDKIVNTRPVPELLEWRTRL